MYSIAGTAHYKEVRMLTEREKWRTTGNGQGNFSSGRRNTGPMRKLMKKQQEEEKRRKRVFHLKNFFAYREAKQSGRV